MLWRDDPLSEWMGYPGSQWSGDLHSAVKRPVVTFAQFLDGLEAELGREGKINLYAIPMPDWWMPMPASELQRAEALYRRMAKARGTGTTMYQEAMLQWIALAQDEGSVPFWLEMLDLQVPREKVRYARRLRATAALAFLIVTLDSQPALEALLQAMRSHDPDVRTLAIYHLGRAYEDEEEEDGIRELPSVALQELSKIAVVDPDFEPRFQARVILRAAGLPPLLDVPGGAFSFRVRYWHDKRIYRTLELRSEQTLEDLHLAIYDALGWDEKDDPYEFFMNGELYDARYAFGGPPEVYAGIPVDLAILGELGLVFGQIGRAHV